MTKTNYLAVNAHVLNRKIEDKIGSGQCYRIPVYYIRAGNDLVNACYTTRYMRQLVRVEGWF